MVDFQEIAFEFQIIMEEGRGIPLNTSGRGAAELSRNVTLQSGFVYFKSASLRLNSCCSPANLTSGRVNGSPIWQTTGEYNNECN